MSVKVGTMTNYRVISNYRDYKKNKEVCKEQVSKDQMEAFVAETLLDPDLAAIHIVTLQDDYVKPTPPKPFVPHRNKHLDIEPYAPRPIFLVWNQHKKDHKDVELRAVTSTPDEANKYVEAINEENIDLNKLYHYGIVEERLINHLYGYTTFNQLFRTFERAANLDTKKRYSE